MGWIITYDMTT